LFPGVAIGKHFMQHMFGSIIFVLDIIKNWVCWVTGMNISIGPIGYMLYKQSSGSNRNLGYVTSMQHWIGYAA
jgi:hypothetical protein